MNDLSAINYAMKVKRKGKWSAIQRKVAERRLFQIMSVQMKNLNHHESVCFILAKGSIGLFHLGVG